MRRRAADVRRFHQGHRGFRRTHPAADDLSPACIGAGDRVMSIPTGYAITDSPSVTLPARPEPLRLKASETALIVVDMQNAYASKGGYIDIAGFDVSGAPAAIERTKLALEAARKAGVTVIYFQNGWDADYKEAGTPASPNWHKS